MKPKACHRVTPDLSAFICPCCEGTKQAQEWANERCYNVVLQVCRKHELVKIQKREQWGKSVTGRSNY